MSVKADAVVAKVKPKERQSSYGLSHENFGLADHLISYSIFITIFLLKHLCSGLSLPFFIVLIFILQVDYLEANDYDGLFSLSQSNNEKLLENPYLQMRGLLQLSNE